MPTDLGISFVSPIFYLQEGNKALNDYSIDLKITCESPLSQTGPEGQPDLAINTFTLTYRNQCYDTEIIKASKGSYQIPLYKSDTKTYTMSQ